MFNLSYFKYLIKSKKFLILFVSLVSVLFCLLGINTSIFEIYALPNLVLSGCLAVAMPIIVFHFIQNKKAVDSYFSLSVSRRELLITGLIFSFLVSLLPYFVTFVIGSLGNLTCIKEFDNFSYIEAFLILLTLALAIIVVNLFVSLTYSVANSNTDGLIMVMAYSLLPVLIYAAVSVFMETFVYGQITEGLEYIMLLSPYHSAGNVILQTILNIRDKCGFEICYLASTLVQTIVYAFALYKTFIKRKVERAETPSNNVFAYPIVIYSYVFILLFFIGSSFTPDLDLGEFLLDRFILYIVVFVCFVVAHFVYKKKFYIDFKMPSFFIITVVISLLFCTVAKDTKGFGLAYQFNDFGEKTGYTITINSYTFKGQNNEALIEYFNKLTNDEVYCVTVEINNPSEESKEILDRMRIEAIDNYYKEGDFNSSTNMQIYKLVYKFNNLTKYRYYSFFNVTLDDIIALDKDPGCSIVIDATYNTYDYRNGEISVHIFDGLYY